MRFDYQQQLEEQERQQDEIFDYPRQLRLEREAWEKEFIRREQEREKAWREQWPSK